jgi:hypothetical protein
MQRVSVNKSLVLECLKELSDIEYQRTVWIVGAADKVTGLDDVVAGLFDDSALGKALEKNTVIFTEPIDSMFRLLDQKIAFLPRNITTSEIIELPVWKEIADISNRIHEMIA